MYVGVALADEVEVESALTAGEGVPVVVLDGVVVVDGEPLVGDGVVVEDRAGVPLSAKYPAGQAEHAAAPLAE